MLPSRLWGPGTRLHLQGFIRQGLLSIVVQAGILVEAELGQAKRNVGREESVNQAGDMEASLLHPT